MTDGFAIPFTDSSLKDAKVTECGLTAAWLVDILRQAHEEFRSCWEGSQVSNVTAEIISEGKGFMSDVYKTTVTFVTGSAYTYAIKVPNTRNMLNKIDSWTSPGEKERMYDDARKDLVKCHNAECDFLECFRDIPGFPLPTLYYARRLEPDLAVPGIIIMEDFSDKGHIGGFVQSANAVQIRNIVKHFAAYHKHLLCHESEKWRGIEGGPAHLDGSLQAMYPKVWSDLDNMAPGKCKPLLEKLKNVASLEFTKYALLDRPKEMGLPSLLCHDDLWTNNILFKKADDGTGQNEVAAFIDWQTVFTGSPMLDFAQYLISCADGEVRREAEQWIVDVYLEDLRRLMNDAGKELPDGISRDRLIEAYKLALITQALRLTVIVSIEQKARDEKRNEHNSRILEAESQKLLLRLRHALEDACRAVDHYAGNFVAKQADESHL